MTAQILAALIASHAAVLAAAKTHPALYRIVDDQLVLTPALIEELARNAAQEILAVLGEI